MTLSINQNRAINDLSKYVIGASVAESGEPSGIVGGTLLMGGISGAGWAWKNKKSFKKGFQKLASDSKEMKQIVNSANKYSSSARFSKFRNKWAGAGEYTSKAELEALSEKLAKNNKYSGVKQLIDDSLKSGKNYSQALKKAEQLKAATDLEQYNAKVLKQTVKGSKLRKLKNKARITKLSKGVKSLAAKSGKFRGLLKCVKGNAAFAVFAFGIGVLSDVVPAFSLGTGKGFKQLGKTTLKTGCEVGGWAAGMALGAKAGALIGTCIGGPVGTVVGGLVGIIGGLAGSFLASKLADKVVGPSEVELAQKDNAEEIAQMAKTDSETLNEVVNEAYAQLLEKAVSGEKLTEDDLKAKEAIEKLIGEEIDLQAEAAAYMEAQLSSQNDDDIQTQINKQEKENTQIKNELAKADTNSGSYTNDFMWQLMSGTPTESTSYPVYQFGANRNC